MHHSKGTIWTDQTVKVFAVEDDPAYAQFLSYVLSLNPDWEYEIFANGQDFLAQLHQRPPDRHARLFFAGYYWRCFIRKSKSL